MQSETARQADKSKLESDQKLSWIRPYCTSIDIPDVANTFHFYFIFSIFSFFFSAFRFTSSCRCHASISPRTSLTYIVLISIVIGKKNNVNSNNNMRMRTTTIMRLANSICECESWKSTSVTPNIWWLCAWHLCFDNEVSKQIVSWLNKEA